MKFVGLGGGIGSGKSTVGAALADRGAVIIDVDLLSREIQRPGSPVFDAIVERWGLEVVADDGELDRQALARIVFADSAELRVLTATITGPAIAAEIVDRATAFVETDSVVVVEASPLLGGDRRLYGLEGVIIVDVPPSTAIDRLVGQRGMVADDVRARIAKQLPRDERLALADFVLDNSAGPDRLVPQLAAAWHWILELPDAVPRTELFAD